MLRVCITSGEPLQVREVNGKKVYHVNHYVDGFIDFFETFSANNSFYVTNHPTACFDRVKHNSSDIVADYFSHEKFINSYRVPVPFFGEKTTITTGYDIAGTKIVEKSGALSNFNLLEVPVYIGALFLIFLFILAVAGRTLLRHHHRVNLIKLEAANSPNGLLYAMKMEKIQQSSTAAYIRGKIYDDVFSSLFGSSSTCRCVTFLFVILCFYLSAAFNGAYQTSCIEIEEPSLIKSYNELLNHESSVPMFFDQWRKVSDQFEFAPEGSLKKRVWSRLVESGLDLNFYVVGRSGKFGWNLREAQQRLKLLIKKRVVYITSSQFTLFGVGTSCAMGADGKSGQPEELRRVQAFIDPSEPENLIGWAVSLHSLSDRRLMRKLTSLSEFHLAAESHQAAERRIIRFWGGIFGHSKSHTRRQEYVCSDSYRPDIDDELKPMDPGYFKTFFTALILVYCIIIIINRIEYLSFPQRDFRRERRLRRNFRI